MAVWPFARRTTYVNGSLPAINADDLNALQDAIVDLYGIPYLFGDGSDGAYAASSGSPIFGANKNFTTFDLTSTADLSPDEHIIRAQQYIRLRGTSIIESRGVAAADDTTTPGSGAGSANQTLGNGGNGGAGGSGSGNAGQSRTNTSLGGSGGAGGPGDPGNLGGAGGVASLNAQLDPRELGNLIRGMLSGYNGSSYGLFPVQGGGGGGGGGYASGNGVGGGGAGGVIVLCAPIIDIGVGCSINANGGAGGGSTAHPGLGGGSGGGAGGGAIILVCAQLIENGTITAAGGLGGTTGGSVGGNGSAGTIIRRVLF